MSISKRVKFAVTPLALLVLAAGGCEDEEVAGNCSRDADCDPGFICSADHICLCTSDDACADGEFCNASGYCQDYLGCRVDADCGDAADWRCEIGESGSGQCLCKTDAACEEGQFCNTSGSCQKKAGCILDADCGNPDDWRCRISADTGIGECFCETDAACEQGEFCNVHGYCQPNSSCESNEDCPAGRFCNVDTGECLCNPEAQTGCDAGEVCNASGYCQPRPGCYDNSDCADVPDTYCDFNTRTCVPNGTCTSDMQCPLGTICRLDGDQYRCIEGCQDSADCPLDQYCQSNACVDGCQADDFCAFAEYCVQGQCQSAYSEQTPFCKPCDNTNLLSCGTIENSCLIYPYESDDFAQQSDEYCAPDCSGNERCPNGFRCNTVITIKQSDLCHSDADCPAGLPCLKSPEEDQGFCPCTQDMRNACPENTCLQDTCGMMDVCSTLSMMGTNLPCQDDSDCHLCTVTWEPCDANGQCPDTVCELYDDVDYGGCVSAKACGLLEGVHCPPP